MTAVRQVFAQVRRRDEFAVRCSDDTAVVRQQDASLAALQDDPEPVLKKRRDASDIFGPSMTLRTESLQAGPRCETQPRGRLLPVRPMSRPVLIGAGARLVAVPQQPAELQRVFQLRKQAQRVKLQASLQQAGHSSDGSPQDGSQAKLPPARSGERLQEPLATLEERK